MKTLNIILFLIAGIMTHAQPTVTRTGVDRINIPSTFRAEDVTTTSVTAGPSGANVTWDFSAYFGSNVATTTTSACPGETNCFRFPGANRITKPLSIDSYNFNSVSDLISGSVRMRGWYSAFQSILLYLTELTLQKQYLILIQVFYPQLIYIIEKLNFQCIRTQAVISSL